MKALFLSVLSSLALSVQGQGCVPHCDACSEVPDIAKITCNPAGGSCTIEKGESSTEDPDYNSLLEGITVLDADICRQKCKEQVKLEPLEENQCKFYRWEEGHQRDKKSTCSLQTTCPEPSSYCGTSACKSGQLGCNDDCQQVIPCSLAKTEWDHTKFHVICTDKLDGDVNIYSDDIVGKEINDETICSTIRMCDEWTDVAAEETYYRQLAVVCDGIGRDGAEAGKWKIMEKTGSNELSTAMIGDGTKIVEQECTSKCTDLGPLTHIDHDWVDLICDTALEDKTLKDPNSCIMLCDNHLKMTIDCDFYENGEKKWLNGKGEELNDAKITCD